MEWYLKDRKIPLPTCPPAIRTPEPRNVRGAQFDPARVDRCLAAFRQMRHTQGRWAGRVLEPSPWQVAYILAPVMGWTRFDREAGRRVRIVNVLYTELPRKNGKALALDTPTLTTAGWSSMGELQEGDQVFGPDGLPATVTFTSDVFPDHRCYRVRLSDGQEFTADAGHLWTVRDRYRARTVTVDTETMAGQYLVGGRTTHTERRYSLALPRPIQQPEAVLPIDPYVLGTWLGDGATACGRITSADWETWQEIENAGYKLSDFHGRYTRAVYGLQAELRALGVLGDKHVPEAYLQASEQQRRDLLAGLMDTDGTVSLGSGSPQVEFTSTRLVLAEAVLQLARSLGWKATLREGRARLRGVDCGPKYRVAWNAYADEAPFRLARKMARLLPRGEWPARSRTLQVVEITEVPSVPTRCIQVDREDGLFLVGRGFAITHNTTLSGGLALYLTGADGEAGAQVLAAATTENQAGYVFEPLKQLVAHAPGLRKVMTPRAKRILHPASGSYLQVVSSAADALHGGNIHGAVIDELHLHKSPDLVEAIETGTGARDQPLIVIITTADDGRQDTIYARKRDYVEKLARGVFKDPSTFGVIWAAPKDADPFAEETMKRANPGYGVSPTKAFMSRAAAKARQSPAELSSFQRLHLGIRTNQATRYIDLDVWDRNAGIVVEDDLAGLDCYGGIDLSSTSDLCALNWTFPDGDGGVDVLWRHWLPERAFKALDERTAGKAAVWRRDGLLTVTPGDVADYDFIEAQIDQDMTRFDVQAIAYDRWNASQLVNNLVAKEAPMVQLGQGFSSMSAPLKQIKHLLLEGTADRPRFRHGGNDLMRWQIDNLAVTMDAAGNVKPDKKAAGDKIDGISAMVDAMSEVILSDPDFVSAYGDDHGVEVI